MPLIHAETLAVNYRAHKDTDQPFTIELLVSSINHERMLVPYVDNLKRLGIRAVLRRVDSNQMTTRMRSYDFDATIRKIYTWKLPFPARMRSQFTTQYADLPNMTNYGGIRNLAVDALIEQIAHAKSEAAMNTAGRALDRVLLHGFYVIPDGHPVGRHIVHWDRFGHPQLGIPHLNWTGLPHLWWFDEKKSKRVEAGLTGAEE